MNKKKTTRRCILYFRERRERAKLETIAPTGRCCRYAMVDWVRGCRSTGALNLIREVMLPAVMR